MLPLSMGDSISIIEHVLVYLFSQSCSNIISTIGKHRYRAFPEHPLSNRSGQKMSEFMVLYPHDDDIDIILNDIVEQFRARIPDQEGE